MTSCSAVVKPQQALQPLREIEQQLQDSIRAVEVYSQEHPHVFNTNKLSRRIRSDLRYIQQLLSEPEQQVTWARWQGCVNNLKGFKGEMLALQEAPGVVAVCKKFRASATANGSHQQPQLSAAQSDSSRDTSSGSEAGSPRAGGVLGAAPGTITTGSGSNRGSSPGAAELLVEVDVVADFGLTWIEVKNQELFGVQSGHFIGGSHGKGLADQITHMLAVAAAPQHARRGRSPQVVVYFPSGVDAEVASALEALGAKVANGVGTLAACCGIAGNNVVNLDVTTLCALVSEVSWRDPHCDELQAWAERTVHWKVCLEAQQQRPLLHELKSVMGHDRQLVVSCAAVSQFEILLQQFSGPLERQRWEQLLPQLRVYHCSAGCASSGVSSSGNNAGHQQACAVCGEHLVQQQAVGVYAPDQLSSTDQLLPQLEGGCFPLSDRLQSLEKMSLLQQAVFSLGDALHAVTVTANGSAVRAAAACGVMLDVQQHRPVWLTGL